MIYAFVAAGFAIVVAAVLTGRCALRSPIRHRWYWAFLSILCSPGVSLDTGTGLVSTHILPIIFFGLAYERHANGMLVSVGLPMGALLFRQRRRMLIARAFPAMSDDALDTK